MARFLRPCNVSASSISVLLSNCSFKFIPFLTAAKSAFASASDSFDGTPFLKLSKSFDAAKPLIFDPDIPVTPSASGSRSPAEITSTDLNS